jgi:hypothetical protein
MTLSCDATDITYLERFPITLLPDKFQGFSFYYRILLPVVIPRSVDSLVTGLKTSDLAIYLVQLQVEELPLPLQSGQAYLAGGEVLHKLRGPGCY